MAKRWFVGGLGSAVFCVTFAVGCDNPSSKLPTTPSPPATQGITISGPSSLAPGQSGQYFANVRLSDGGTKTVASGVQWSVSNPSFLSVDINGVVTAQPRVGEAFVRAQAFSGRSASFGQMEVIIVPTGTFRLTGTVTDGNSSSFRVPNALVEVTPGPISTTTDSQGQFRLYGVPPDVDVKVTAAGYATVNQSLRLTSHSSISVPLTPSGPRMMLSGPYLVEVDTAGGCTSLPAALQQRSYDADVTTTGSLVEVALTEPRFRINGTNRGNKFIGRATATGVIFTLDYYGSYYYGYYGPAAYPNVAERLSDNTILVVEGTANTSGNSSKVSGLLDGGITRWDPRFPTQGFWMGSCGYGSTPVQLTLTHK
jgi:hypothetical protein